MTELGTELPPEAEAVIARWNPEGMDLLQRLRAATGDRRAVAVFSPSGQDLALLEQELALLSPSLDIVSTPLEASVVVMALDAAAVVGRSELAVVDELLSTGSRAVFTLYGIEAHRDWRKVRERNVDLLSRHTRGSEDLRIWPISARLANISRRVPADAGDAGVVFGSSGLAQLHAAILEALPEDLPADRGRHLWRATRSVLCHTEQDITAEAQKLRAEDEVIAALRAERTALTARRDGGRAEVSAALHTQLQLARVDLLHEVAARVRDANAGVRDQVDQTSRSELPHFPLRLGGLVQELAVEVDRDIRERMGELAARLDLGAESGGMRSAVRTELAAAGPTHSSTPEIGAGPSVRRRGIEDQVLIMVGAAGGLGVGKLVVMPLSLVPALNYVTLPVALLLGAVAAWWLTRARRFVMERAQMRQWATEALVNVKAQLEQRLYGALAETESRLTAQVAQASMARMVEVDRRIDEIGARVRVGTAQRSGQLMSCEQDLDVITRTKNQLASLSGST